MDPLHFLYNILIDFYLISFYSYTITTAEFKIKI